MSAFGTPVKKDAAIEPEDTYQSSIDELGKAYRQIVEEQNQKRANLLDDKSRRKLFRRIADSSNNFYTYLPQMDIYTHFAMADTAQLAKEDKLTEFVDRASKNSGLFSQLQR